MLSTISLIVGIVLGVLTISISTVTSFLAINKSFRRYIDDLIIQHEKDLKIWAKDLIEQYYYPLDDQIRDLRHKIKDVENRNKYED